MIEHNNSDELIEQYLSGSLGGDMLNEFKEKLATDEQFRKEVALQKAIIRNIKEVGRKEWLQKLQSLHDETHLEDVPKAQEKPAGKRIFFSGRYQKRYFLAAAASLLLIIFSALFFVKTSNTSRVQDLFVAYYQPYPDLAPGTRSLSTGINPIKEEAFKAYDKGDYAESILRFNSILEKGEDEIVLFYLGNAYLSADKPVEAENTLKKYLDKYKEFSLESKWYLSLSYLKQAKVKEARMSLEGLASQNNAYSKKALEILNKL